MSEDSQQMGLDEVIEQNDKSDVSVDLHPHIRQLGIELPDGWQAVSLGEIGQLDTSSVDKKSNSDERRIHLVNYMDVYEKHRINGDIVYMEVTAPKSHIERSQVRPGDILFTPSSEEPRDIGNSAVVTEEMERTLHSYHTVRLRPTSDSIQLDIGFSGWFANAPYVAKQFARRATGSTRYTLTLGDFSDTQVLVPPLPEQRKIATVLYTVDRAIEKTEELVEQLSRVRKGVFQSVFKRGVTDSDTKQTRVLSIDTEIPEHWEITSVGDISILVTDGAHLTPEKSDSGYYLLGARNVQNGYIDLESADYVSSEEYERLIEKCHPEPNDILMSCRGVGLGRIGLMPEGLECALLCSAALIKLSESVHPEYIEKALRHIDTQKQIKALQTQSAQPNLFQNEIARLEFPLPPIEEQEKIANILSRYDEQIQHEQEYKEQLNRLKHGLLQDLLSGTVRTTDTNIEVPDEIAQYG